MKELWFLKIIDNKGFIKYLMRFKKCLVKVEGIEWTDNIKIILFESTLFYILKRTMIFIFDIFNEYIT